MSSRGRRMAAIQLDRGDHGVRVDRVLLRHLRDEKGVSRNRIQKWIDAGDVLINGAAPPRAAWRVQAGDELRVRVARYSRARPGPRPSRCNSTCSTRTTTCIAVNKPAGLVVHPSYRNTTGTLMNGLLARAQAWPTGSTPALVGRLDKLTSGIVLVTKRPTIHASLQRAMAREPHRQGLSRHRVRQADAAARHDRSRARSRSLGSPAGDGDRSRRPAVGDEVRTARHDGDVFDGAMPADHRTHASDSRAPGGETMADRRRCDVWIHVYRKARARSRTLRRQVSRGRRCMRGG